MRQAYALLGVLFVLIVGAALFFGTQEARAPTTDAPPNDAAAMELALTSSAFAHEGSIPSKYTCDGDPPAGGVSPPLEISGVPEGVRSLALIMDDPDAVGPTGKVWDHWVVFNIPPDTRVMQEGSDPGGAQGMTSFGKPGYGGPCPPDGEHRYFFKLYALDTTLDLPEGATKAEVGKAMEGHVLAEAQLMGRYARN